MYAREEFVDRTNAQPAMLDLHGARWDSMGTYVPAPGAKRFEQYEVSFAAKVGLGVAAEYATSETRSNAALALLLQEAVGAVI